MIRAHVGITPPKQDAAEEQVAVMPELTPVAESAPFDDDLTPVEIPRPRKAKQ